MGGCMIILLLPFLMGVGFAMVVVPIALWIYIAWAAIMLLILVGVYVALARKGVFKRYVDGADWKHYTARGVRWVLIIAIVYLLLTGAAAGALQYMGARTFADASTASNNAATARAREVL